MQVLVDVNNSLAVTRLIFNVTVLDENQAPYFQNSTYSISVPEDVLSGRTSYSLAVVRSPIAAVQPNVINIVRDDPDTVTSEFMITSLMLGEETICVSWEVEEHGSREV